MRVHAIINARAGAGVGDGSESLVGLINAAFEARGHEITAEVVEPGKLEATIARWRAEPLEALLVGGGDGSARSAAALLIDTGLPLGLIPLGTLNRLARDLETPIDAAAAAEALAGGRIGAIDVATVNGRIFLCNAMLGLTTRFSAERQRLRGKPVAERLAGYLGVARAMLQRTRRLPVAIDDGGGERKLRAISVIVANNPYADETGFALRRETMQSGELAAYLARHTSGWAAARGAVRALVGRIDDDSDVVQVRSPTLDLRIADRDRVAVSVDGEIEQLETPLHFAIRPGALKVLVAAGSRIR